MIDNTVDMNDFNIRSIEIIFYCFEHDRFVFSTLAREPAESIQFIHNRMPVILSRDAIRDGLNTSFRADEILRSARVCF